MNVDPDGGDTLLSGQGGDWVDYGERLADTAISQDGAAERRMPGAEATTSAVTSRPDDRAVATTTSAAAVSTTP